MDKEIMDFNRCMEEYIRNVEKDDDKIRSIVKMTSTELKIISDININNETASKLAKDYYEIIKELLTALLLSHGLKSSNHECLISFFKEHYPVYEYETGIIHELKNIRNRISYDGFFVEKEYINKNKMEFGHIIELLNKPIDSNMGQMD